VSEPTTLEVPSSTLRDLVSVVTEEGLELESRVLAFAGEARQALRDFDNEALAAGLDDNALDRAAVRAGLGVLHALIERMRDGLAEVLDPAMAEEVAA